MLNSAVIVDGLAARLNEILDVESLVLLPEAPVKCLVANLRVMVGSQGRGIRLVVYSLQMYIFIRN